MLLCDLRNVLATVDKLWSAMPLLDIKGFFWTLTQPIPYMSRTRRKEGSERARHRVGRRTRNGGLVTGTRVMRNMVPRNGERRNSYS